MEDKERGARLGPGGEISEKRFALVLSRAAELEAQSRSAAGPADGRSIQEAEAIAREAGISEENFRRALAELDGRRLPSAWSRRLFGDLRPGVLFVVEASPSLARLEETLDGLAEAAGRRGAGSVGRLGLRWNSDGYESQRSGKALDVAVTPRDGRTEISVRWDLRNAAGGVFGGICGGLGLGWGFGIGMGVGLGLLGSPLFALFAPVAGLGLSYLIARAVMNRLVRRCSAETERIADHLRRRIAEGEAG